MDVVVYLPEELGAWYAEHRQELGRGWASRVLRNAVIDERGRMEGWAPDDEAAGWAALAQLEAEPIDL